MADEKQPLVVFSPSGKRGRFPVGTPILDAARSLGVDIAAVEAALLPGTDARGNGAPEASYSNVRRSDEPSSTTKNLVLEPGLTVMKTSTGFASGGATLADVRLLADAVDGRALVKAAGGIRDWAYCDAMLKAGAARIGTSAGVAITRQWQQGRR